jgi:hypothetical protein
MVSQLMRRRRAATINAAPPNNIIIIGHSRFEVPVAGKVSPATVIGCLKPVPLSGAYTASV